MAFRNTLERQVAQVVAGDVSDAVAKDKEHDKKMKDEKAAEKKKTALAGYFNKHGRVATKDCDSDSDDEQKPTQPIKSSTLSR